MDRELLKKVAVMDGDDNTDEHDCVFVERTMVCNATDNPQHRFAERLIIFGSIVLIAVGLALWVMPKHKPDPDAALVHAQITVAVHNIKKIYSDTPLVSVSDNLIPHPNEFETSFEQQLNEKDLEIRALQNKINTMKPQ